jgi:hypothetical protein
MTIDTRRAQLDALRAAGAPAAAVNLALKLLDLRVQIAQSRYNSEREREELSRANQEAAANLRVVVDETDAAVDRQTASEQQEHDRTRSAAASERRSLRDVIDVERLRESDDVEELLGLVREACDVLGDVAGAEARRLVEQRVRQQAAREQARHVLNGPWFRALCALRASPRGGSRSDVAERGEQRKRQARALVAQVASVVGLGPALQAIRRTPPAPPEGAPQPARSRMVFGSYWERQAAARRQ